MLGYHSKNSISCYFFSTIAILIALFIIKLTPDEHMLFISMVMLTIALPVYMVIAPVDTDGKRFDYNEKKYYRKRMIKNLIIEYFTVMILYLIGLCNYIYLISLGIVLAAILVLLGSVNNYER